MVLAGKLIDGELPALTMAQRLRQTLGEQPATVTEQVARLIHGGRPDASKQSRS